MFDDSLRPSRVRSDPIGMEKRRARPERHASSYFSKMSPRAVYTPSFGSATMEEFRRSPGSLWDTWVYLHPVLGTAACPQASSHAPSASFCPCSLLCIPQGYQDQLTEHPPHLHDSGNISDTACNHHQSQVISVYLFEERSFMRGTAH